MASSSFPLQFETVRNPLARYRRFLRGRTPSILRLSRRTTSSVMIPLAKFDLAEIMGGRGICNGERGLGKLLESSVVIESEQLSSSPAISPDSDSSSSSSNVGGDEGFDKELLGLTGGFPGGEKGLQRFIEKNPPTTNKSDGVVNPKYSSSSSIHEALVDTKPE